MGPFSYSMINASDTRARTSARLRQRGNTMANQDAHQPQRSRFRLPWQLRAVNAIGGGLRSLGLPVGRLDADALLRQAQQKTGLEDFGEPGFRPLLQTLMRSLEQEADLNTIGRISWRNQTVRHLSNRLRIQRDLTATPAILEQTIAAPLFIVGFPRAGTTVLHNLLAQDPEARVPLLWELRQPSPPPRSEAREPDTERSDPRIAEARDMVRQVYRRVPHLRAIHELDPTGPEECYFLFKLAFANPLIDAEVHVPTYMEALRTLDWTVPYRLHQNALKLLQWHIKGTHWVLKAPSHLHTLGALLDVYPDARVIQTHRDPRQVAASFCSTYEATRTLYSSSVDLARLGDDWLASWGRAIDHMLEVRERAPASQFHDVIYPRLLADPIAEVERIYDHFDMTVSPTMRAGMERWLREHRKGRHGAHRYQLERYGLSDARVLERFADYVARFPTVEAASIS